MADKVVDASAVAAVLFGEDDAEHVSELTHGHRLFAPTLLHFEIASVGLKKVRRQEQSLSDMLVSVGLQERLGISYSEVDAGEVVELAHTSRLSAYDASYLWLSRRLQAELVTLDKKLGRVAGAHP